MAAVDDGPLRQLDSRLLAARARAAILRAIFDGRFEAKLPNEERLAAMLNVSRTTVRTALQGLERDGVVTRQRAIGTMINPHIRPSSLTLQRLIGFDSLLTERGHEIDVAVAARWGQPSDEMAAVFALEAGTECLLIEKAYRADDTLALVILDAVPRSELVAPDAIGHVDASLFTFSRRCCRAAINHAVVKLVPMIQQPGMTRLDVPSGTPFLRLQETHYSVRGEAVAFSMIEIDDRFVQLEVVRIQ